MGYMGSEDFIRLQFEEYLLALISSVKYHNHLKDNHHDPKSLLSEIGITSHSYHITHSAACIVMYMLTYS